MISRVAEGCFWMGRYLERVETLARLLDVHHALHLDAALPVQKRWRVLIEFTGQHEDFGQRIGAASANDGETVQQYLVWDEKHPASLFSALRSARENARTVREIMSMEAWESINDLWLWIRSREAERLYQRQRGAFYERLMRATLLFHGVSFGTMLHDEPFSFVKLGRAVERAGQTARILDSHVDLDARETSASYLSVLRCCCAYDPFFRSGMQSLDARTLSGFLIFDRSLPRSVLYNLDEARRLLYDLRREDPVGLPRRSRAALEKLRGGLLQMNVSDVERQGVHSTLGWVTRATDELCDAIHDDYLDPPVPWLRHCVRALDSAETPSAPEEDERAA